MPVKDQSRRLQDTRSKGFSCPPVPRRQEQSPTRQLPVARRTFFRSAFSLRSLTQVFCLSAHAYLITWFARARNSGESVSPICFAAFKLITNSNFVGCCTGKSAGLAPFKILST